MWKSDGMKVHHAEVGLCKAKQYNLKLPLAAIRLVIEIHSFCCEGDCCSGSNKPHDCTV